MKGFTGATFHLQPLMCPASTKRAALLFDRIFIADLSRAMAAAREMSVPHDPIDEAEWLLDRGILAECEYVPRSAHEPRHYDAQGRKALEIELERLDAAKALARSGDEVAAQNSLVLEFELIAKVTALGLRETSGLDIQPYSSFGFHGDTVAGGTALRADVLRVVLNTLPTPDDSVPWEQILEYRADPDSYRKFLALRDWINEVARRTLSQIEIEQKLEYLMEQYKRHMALHRMKVTAGALETIVVSSAEILEDLSRLRFGKLAKSMFAFKSRNIALLEGELTVPGSELAYVIKAHDTFRDAKPLS